MAATIKDIAKACGVSEGTVDRALNNRKGIKRSTYDRIMETARRFNYKPNRVAQSLAMGRTMTIGIVCFDLYNNFFAMLIDIIEAYAKEQGYFINLVLTHGDREKELDGIQYLSDRQVDGIIIFPVGQGQDYIELLKKTQIPIVTIYNKVSDDFVHIGVDDRQVMRDAVRHIVSKGYRNIIFANSHITDMQEKGVNVYTLYQRQQGYLDGLREMGVSSGPCVIEGKQFNQILHNEPFQSGERTALLCVCDNYALAALEFFKQKRYDVPGRIGIMGYDNIDTLHYVTPRIATVEYNVELLGQTLFQTLYQLMDGSDPASDYYLEYHIIDGESL